MAVSVSRATCPSGNVGHGWVKNRWNIPYDGGSSEVIDPATGFRRVFILARISDNPYLAGTAYERQLEVLPEATRRALLEGRWAVFEGAVFSEWNPRIHVCDPFAIPAEWEIWRGFASPAAVLWFGLKTYARGMSSPPSVILLVCFDHIARLIANADHSIMCAARHTTSDRMPAHLQIASGFRFDSFFPFPLPCSS
jgi:hypothetical protein